MRLFPKGDIGFLDSLFLLAFFICFLIGLPGTLLGLAEEDPIGLIFGISLLLLSIFLYTIFLKLNLNYLKGKAEKRETAKDYDSAIQIWEELGEINEAARIRKIITEQSKVKVDQTVVHGDQVTKTEIKDSVVSKSNIGSGGGSSKAEELREAKSLFEEGLIDDDEFKQMKKEILGK